MNTPDSTPRIGLRDLAARLGISHTTVSRALRNSPLISAAVRTRVQETAREMGYRPDPMLSSLAKYRRGKQDPSMHTTLAWINAWPAHSGSQISRMFDHQEFSLYWKGALAGAERFGYHLEELDCHTPGSLARLERILIARNIRGIIVPPQPLTPAWGSFDWAKFSAIRIGRSCLSPKLHVITSDQVANSILAFRAMRERGYTRIGLVTGLGSVARGNLQKAGFLMAQSTPEEPNPIPVLLLDESRSPDGVGGTLKRWLEENRPDAIFSDVAALSAMLAQLGYRVPEDIGLAEYSILDGNASAGIHQNSEEIGRVAILFLISLLDDNALGVPNIFRQILISGSWVDGASLPPKKATK